MHLKKEAKGAPVFKLNLFNEHAFQISFKPDLLFGLSSISVCCSSELSLSFVSYFYSIDLDLSGNPEAVNELRHLCDLICKRPLLPDFRKVGRTGTL